MTKYFNLFIYTYESLAATKFIIICYLSASMQLLLFILNLQKEVSREYILLFRMRMFWLYEQIIGTPFVISDNRYTRYTDTCKTELHTLLYKDRSLNSIREQTLVV